MSRETDSSSSGPHGRAGAAYPSGTPPYGSPAQGVGPDGGTDGAGLGPGDRRSDEPKTETTLTTRIRINIPGSRPIPPVVMRTPVGDADGDRGTEPQGLDDTAAGPGPLGGPSSALSGPAPSAPAPGGTVNGGAAPQASAGSTGGSASGDDGGEPTSDWFAPRKASPKGPSTPSAPAPSSGTGSGDSGTGAYDVSGAVANGPLGSGGEPRRDDLPYFPDGDRPAGPTGGPVTGDGPMITPEPPAEAGPYGAGAADPYGMGTDPFAGGPAGPGGPGRLSDDTAILTPQKPVPGAGGPRPPAPGGPGAPGGNVSGDTLNSGIPVVPPAQNAPFAPGAPGEGPVPHTPPKLPEPVQQKAPAAPASKKAKKKGRSKLVMLAGLVVVAGCGAYGAGLLMNHADVPKGTTVLGVDIGGGTRDEAVKKLDAALGERVNKPLKLTVGGDTVTLKPDQSGLTLDSQATVRAAAGSDYNPVSVIGGLFGGERVVEPEMPVDEEKLAAALERAAGGSGSAKEGTVKFVPGKAVAVHGRAGKGIDAEKASAAVAEAYKKQVETGSAGSVAVPVTNRKPTVSDAEVDRFMREFAKPAMSGNVTIKAGASEGIPLGPARSLPQVLGVKAVNGKLVETYDLKALKALYGSTYDGVLVQRGNGKKTPVQPTDVAQAMGKALRGKTPAERIGVIETNVS
ncbi:hypothetical protein [Streptomyces spectabilis]|uniref:Peptidoglycan binding domain-containing protein n=2 Tax=Streptomyces spectabilis TaxID=68270 RepID=A0A7W8AUE7_STRST|nr:hypothetical protein [Streptomyces spectabilis]MBB5104748.1 hypothetical protein [Streptomyces spectabilis]MCI3904899.1 hypothetical protein [Streptomyces spectabilis]GGV01934.1 hypothetical protein GCM10010245_06070 [Streptomyces spectabilis]